MPIFRTRSELPASAREAYDWHARPGALERLLPPVRGVRLLDRGSDPAQSASLAPGTRVRLVLPVGPLRLRWEARHEVAERGRLFIDRQVRGPFARWEHTHRFIPRGDDACLLEDEIDYRLPGGPLGALLGGAYVRGELERLFRLRHARTAHDLARHRAYRGQPPLTVAVSGAGGLIGRRLCAFLGAGGHTVRRLVRRESGAPDEIAWAPTQGIIHSAALRGVDAVIHLGGAGIADRRWSAARKREIWESRVESTALLARTLAGLHDGPRVLVVASAIGTYGDAGERPVDEGAARGEGFLAELCAAWEDAAEPARQAGLRTVHVRTGLVLAGEGGLLARLTPLFALGLGGRLGNGRQRMSWIAMEDLLSVYLGALREPRWQGPINAVAPEAPSNAEFTRVFARVLRRPALAPAPAAAIRLAFGQLGREALLAGQRVVPARLAELGFAWRLPELERALAEELGRDPPRDPQEASS